MSVCWGTGETSKKKVHKNVPRIAYSNSAPAGLNLCEVGTCTSRVAALPVEPNAYAINFCNSLVTEANRFELPPI